MKQVLVPSPSPRARAAARPVRGFTLIELMIVVAVIAILASIAIPAYQDAVRQGRRGQAKADLVAAAQLAERWRTINANSYAGFTLIETNSPSTGTAYYTLALTVTATTFSITATPNAAGRQNTDTCGTLSIDQAGAKKHSTGADARCSFGSTGT